jgi:hypothetical protein
VIRITLSLIFVSILSPCVSAQSCDPKNPDLRHANLRAPATNDIVAVITKDLLENFGPVLSDSPNLRDTVLSSCTSFPKLAASGRVILVTPGPAYPVLGGAAAMSNQDIWLFRQLGDHAVLIFRSFGQIFGPVPNSYHNGMLDFEFSFTEPHSDPQSLETYRFDGKRYVFHDCYIEDSGPERPCSK